MIYYELHYEGMVGTFKSQQEAFDCIDHYGYDPARAKIYVRVKE